MAAIIFLPIVYAGLAALLLWRALWLVGRYVRDRALRRETCLHEFEDLGLPRRGRKIQGTAVICGGRCVSCRFTRSTRNGNLYLISCYSGILAARVCHDHFERVVIIEPEEWLSTKEGRLTAAWTQTSQRSRIIQYFSLNGE